MLHTLSSISHLQGKTLLCNFVIFFAFCFLNLHINFFYLSAFSFFNLRFLFFFSCLRQFIFCLCLSLLGHRRLLLLIIRQLKQAGFTCWSGLRMTTFGLHKKFLVGNVLDNRSICVCSVVWRIAYTDIIICKELDFLKVLSNNFYWPVGFAVTFSLRKGRLVASLARNIRISLYAGNKSLIMHGTYHYVYPQPDPRPQ